MIALLKNRHGTLRGHELSPKDREYVLAVHVHRYTGDHFPTWASTKHPDGYTYPVQFTDDLDWLRNTYFKVTKKMNLDHRVKSCESYPTWPNNPELR